MTGKQIRALFQSPQESGYSAAYVKAMRDAAEFVGLRYLDAFEPIAVSEAQWSRGVDALPQDWRHAAAVTFGWVLGRSGYELSYSQLRNAVLETGRAMGKIRVREVAP